MKKRRFATLPQQLQIESIKLRVIINYEPAIVYPSEFIKTYSYL